MRKSVFCLLAALALVLTLAACGGGKPSSSPYDTSLPQAIAEAGAFSEELDSLDGDTAFFLFHLADYGIQREEMTDCTMLCSSGGTCEQAAVLVFDWAGDSQADAVKSALDDYVKGQISANENYRPAEIPKLEDALIQQQGDSFLLVVANDLEAAKGAIS